MNMKKSKKQMKRKMKKVLSKGNLMVEMAQDMVDFMMKAKKLKKKRMK